MITSLTCIFAYLSPETMLPMTSILASAVGLFLLFGRTMLRLARAFVRVIWSSSRPVTVVPRPHFRHTGAPLVTTREAAADRHNVTQATGAPRSSTR